MSTETNYPLRLPTVHLNGTGKAQLIEIYCEASQALDLAYNALKQAAPNGRDYYLQGNHALGDAIEQHNSRLSRLDAIKKEIDDITIAVDEAGN